LTEEHRIMLYGVLAMIGFCVVTGIALSM